MPTAQKLPKKQKSKALPNAAAATEMLSTVELGERARQAAEEILIAGQAENTLRSYRSALRYWCAWGQVRYGKALTLPVSTAVVVQFLVDHLARGRMDQPVCELPTDIDELLVKSRFKGHLGPLKLNTVVHRLAVLSKLHQLRKLANPCEDPQVRHLLSRAKRASSKRGETIAKKTAATREPLEAMIATCDDSLEGIRDKALLLFAWASGGRRRSEVADATVEQLTKIDDRGYLFRLTRSKTNQDGNQNKSASADKPVRGIAGDALRKWLDASGVNSGPIFRRLWKSRIGPPLSPAAVADIVKRRSRLAEIEGDWGGHSLRSGFITEAGRRNIPIGDVMAMTEHRCCGALKVDPVCAFKIDPLG